MIKDHTYKDNFDKDIIVRFLEGYATKEEESALSNWVNSAQENKTEFLETKEIWNMAVITKELQALDVDADWNKISGKLSDRPTLKAVTQTKAKNKATTKEKSQKVASPPAKEATVKKMNFTKWIGAIAAGLVLVVAAYFVLQNGVSNGSNSEGPARAQILADGTKVWLNRDGKLTAPDKFVGNDRIVYLTGEAYFEVAHNPKKPFRIICVNTEIQVLGTSFNVRTNDRITDVVVAEGKVKLINQDKETKSIIINPGEVGMSSVLGTTKIPNNRPNYHSWRTGKFTFENTPLKFAIRDLNGWFDKEIILSGSFDCNVTGTFDKSNQKEIIKSLQGPCNFKELEYPNDPNHKNKIYLKKIK